MSDPMVPWATYERDRAADERLALQRERALDYNLTEIRKDIGDVAASVEKINANDKRRIGVLVASLLIPLFTSLILLWVTVQIR